MSSAYENVFDKDFDTDDDATRGYLTKDELTAVLEKKGYDSARISTTFRYCDLNQDGKISKQEFIDALSKSDSETKWRRVFNDFDKDSSGELEKNEFAEYLGNYGESQGMTEQELEAAKRFIAKHDTDGSCTLSFDEFMKFLGRK